jgi:phage gpG-like protein
MFTVTVDDRAVMARLGMMGEKVKASLARAIYRQAIDLQRYIVTQKLSAAPGYSATLLHRVTSNLARSIQQSVEVSATQVIGKVYSAGDVKYAAIHEYGGQITRYGKRVGSYTMTMPKRSFMRTSLAENREKITNAIKLAAIEGLKQ